MVLPPFNAVIIVISCALGILCSLFYLAVSKREKPASYTNARSSKVRKVESPGVLVVTPVQNTNVQLRNKQEDLIPLLPTKHRETSGTYWTTPRREPFSSMATHFQRSLSQASELSVPRTDVPLIRSMSTADIERIRSTSF